VEIRREKDASVQPWP